jgi:hypothetical protein
MKVLLIIKKFIFAINIIALISALCVDNVLHGFDPISLWVWIITFFMSLILEAITAGVAGTPNNYLQERTMLRFENRAIRRNQCIIEVREIEKDVWQVNDRFKTQLDMKGWLRQKKYIRELIALRFVLEAYNDARQIAYSLPFGRQVHNLKELSIKFTDIEGKTYCYKIIKNKVVHTSLYMRYRLFGALKENRHGPKEYRNTQHYDISLSDCYRFKLFE